MTSVLLKNCKRPNRGFQGYRTHDDLEALFFVGTVDVALERSRELELEKRLKDREGFGFTFCDNL
jgi:hypothetical protein